MVQPDSPLRQKVNRFGLPLALGIFLLACILLGLQFLPKPKPRAFYSIDDGQTWFTHAVTIPPFSYQGKTAVRAMVFTCDQGQTAFVGYLLRATPEGKAAALAAPPDSPLAGQYASEVKRPGDREWTLVTAPSAAEETPAQRIMTPQAPPGHSGHPVLLSPP